MAAPLAGIIPGGLGGSRRLTPPLGSLDAAAVTASITFGDNALTAAALAATSTTSGLTTAITLATSALAATSTTADLTTAITLATSALAATSTTSNLSTAITLATSALAATSTTSNLSTAIKLAAPALAATSTTADLTTVIKLTAFALAATSTTSGLTTAITLTASALAATSTTSGLTTAITLAASASAASSANATLTIPIYLAHSGAIAAEYPLYATTAAQTVNPINLEYWGNLNNLLTANGVYASGSPYQQINTITLTGLPTSLPGSASYSSLAVEVYGYAQRNFVPGEDWAADVGQTVITVGGVDYTSEPVLGGGTGDSVNILPLSPGSLFFGRVSTGGYFANGATKLAGGTTLPSKVVISIRALTSPEAANLLAYIDYVRVIAYTGATALGVLTVGARFAASALAATSTTADLTTAIKLAASASAATSTTSGLTTGVRFAASALAATSTTSGLTTGIQLAAAPAFQTHTLYASSVTQQLNNLSPDYIYSLSSVLAADGVFISGGAYYVNTLTLTGWPTSYPARGLIGSFAVEVYGYGSHLVPEAPQTDDNVSWRAAIVVGGVTYYASDSGRFPTTYSSSVFFGRPQDSAYWSTGPNIGAGTRLTNFSTPPTQVLVDIAGSPGPSDGTTPFGIDYIRLIATDPGSVAVGWLTTNIKLAASALAATSTTSNLSVGVRFTASALAATSTTSGLTTAITLAASAVATTAINATISGSAASFSGIAAAQAQTTANLTTAVRFSAAVSCVVITGADLTAQIRANASIAATTLAAASLTTQITLAAQASAQASSTPAITTQIKLVASATANTNTVLATLNTGIPLVGSASATTLVAAPLTTQIKLATISTGFASANAGLTTSITLAGNAAAQTSSTPNLQIAVRFASSVTAVVQSAAGLTTAIKLAASVSAVVTVISPELFVSSFRAAVSAASNASATLVLYKLIYANATSTAAGTAKLTFSFQAVGSAREVIFVPADAKKMQVIKDDATIVVPQDFAIYVDRQ